MPAVLVAGRDAGHLTADGAKLLDPSGTLQAGSLMALQKGMQELEWLELTVFENGQETFQLELQPSQ